MENKASIEIASERYRAVRAALYGARGAGRDFSFLVAGLQLAAEILEARGPAEVLRIAEELRSAAEAADSNRDSNS